MANAKEFSEKGATYSPKNIEKFSEKISKKFFWTRENLLFFPCAHADFFKQPLPILDLVERIPFLTKFRRRVATLSAVQGCLFFRRIAFWFQFGGRLLIVSPRRARVDLPCGEDSRCPAVSADTLRSEQTYSAVGPRFSPVDFRGLAH